MVQNEMYDEEECLIYYERVINNLVPQVSKAKNMGKLQISWTMSKLAKMQGARYGSDMRNLL